MKSLLCIYDFDTNLYSCSLILQDDYVNVTHKKSGRSIDFKNQSEFWGKKRDNSAGGWLKEHNDEHGTGFTKDDFVIEKKVKRNNIDFSIAQRTINEQIQYVRSQPWCDRLRLVIGGKGNYRKDINPSYKASRGSKPLMFKELKEWFIKEYKDIIIQEDNVEADDILSIFAGWANKKFKGKEDWKLCLIHRDKDLLQCRGYYWDFFKKEPLPRWQDQWSAHQSLYQQILKGDSTDDIKGIGQLNQDLWEEFKLRGRKYGVGEKNAENLLKDCKNLLDLRERICYLYKEVHGENWEDELNLQYQMVKLMSEKNTIPDFWEDYGK